MLQKHILNDIGTKTSFHFFADSFSTTPQLEIIIIGKVLQRYILGNIIRALKVFVK